MTTIARTRRQAALAAAARSAAPADEGIVTAIVAVTAHQDSVRDVIVPGAFADTLRRMRPKLCWMHDWKIPLGRVLHIMELKPGDKRLPKMLPDGRAWPQEAGALVATMQFNLRTQQGRDMFEHAKEWAKNGEAAFSIGYKVVEGMASTRADGVRVIYQLDLYEVSLVLHGAHNMALALEVKDLTGSTFPDLETKDTPTGITEVKSAEKMIGHGAMVALYLDPTTAGMIAVKDGNPPEELHVTLAFLGDGSAIQNPEELSATLSAAVAGAGALEGTIGGIGTFPEGPDGTPVWVPVDVPGLVELRQKIVTALAGAGMPQQSEHGFTPHLTLGYDLPSLEPVESTPVKFDAAYLTVGEQRFPLQLTAVEAPIEGKAHEAVAAAMALMSGMEGKGGVPGVADTPSDLEAVQRLRDSWSHGKLAVEIGWGTGGDFDRCVALATEHMSEEQAKGWCNLRHKDALGFYPATHAAMEGKALPKAQKCKYGDHPATKRIIHAEGMAYIPVCDKHLAKGKAAAAKVTPDGTSDPSNIDAIRPIEGKSALAAVLEAKTLFNGSAGAVTVQSLGEPERVTGTKKKRTRATPQEGMESKMMSQMKGSHEERREALRNALERLMLPDRKGRDDGRVEPSDCWLSIESTFDTYVLVTIEKGRESTSFSVPWALGADNDEIELGKPVKVELSVVAIPEEGDPTEAEAGEAVRMRFIDPATIMLADATARLHTMPEGKAAFGEEFENSLLELMDALAVKGFDVGRAVMGADESEGGIVDGEETKSADDAALLTDEGAPVGDEDAGADGVPEADEHDGDADDAAPAAEDNGADGIPEADEHDGDEDDAAIVDPSKETITLDPEAVKAQMDELRA